jgi:hypothetical protein
MTWGKGAARRKLTTTTTTKYYEREERGMCRKLYSEVNSWVEESNAFGIRYLMHQRLLPLAIWTVGLTQTNKFFSISMDS